MSVEECFFFVQAASKHNFGQIGWHWSLVHLANVTGSHAGKTYCVPFLDFNWSLCKQLGLCFVRKTELHFVPGFRNTNQAISSDWQRKEDGMSSSTPHTTQPTHHSDRQH